MSAPASDARPTALNATYESLYALAEEEGLIDSVEYELLEEPYTMGGCTHIANASVIEDWVLINTGPPTCPVCRDPITNCVWSDATAKKVADFIEEFENVDSAIMSRLRPNKIDRPPKVEHYLARTYATWERITDAIAIVALFAISLCALFAGCIQACED
ncbi:MAG: hypothetical protein S4CHLAM102_01570 [Chlamydiia bacterium]|nr:hypothetical protein [Chlamydiia bacterium]